MTIKSKSKDDGKLLAEIIAQNKQKTVEDKIYRPITYASLGQALGISRQMAHVRFQQYHEVIEDACKESLKITADAIVTAIKDRNESHLAFYALKKKYGAHININDFNRILKVAGVSIRSDEKELTKARLDKLAQVDYENMRLSQLHKIITPRMHKSYLAYWLKKHHITYAKDIRGSGTKELVRILNQAPTSELTVESIYENYAYKYFSWTKDPVGRMKSFLTRNDIPFLKRKQRDCKDAEQHQYSKQRKSQL